MKYLCENGADVNKKYGSNGITNLIRAVCDGHLETCKSLLEQGANVDLQCND